jgi:hypothetical protein
MRVQEQLLEYYTGNKINISTTAETSQVEINKKNINAKKLQKTCLNCLTLCLAGSSGKHVKLDCEIRLSKNHRIQNANKQNKK